MSMSTLRIGRCGELLVQYRLLRLGVESAPMTTDTGIDLVAYAPGAPHALTIQVKTKLAPSPGGGRGAPALDWRVPETCPADLVALVDLSQERIWLLRLGDVAEMAQQRANGQHHVCMYTCDPSQVRSRRTPFASEYDRFLLDCAAPELFLRGGLAPVP